MTTLLSFVCALLLLVPTAQDPKGEQGAEKSAAPADDAGKTPAQIHIGHVMDAINGTPGGVGLLTILGEEAAIAAQHAELAVSDVGNLEAIQRHLHHVRHAVDPTTEPKGPGKGYGVLRAAEGVETHITLAAHSAGATDKIKLHATHVAASAHDVVDWSKAILAEADKALKATTAEEAAASAQKIRELTRHIVDGFDANGDGKVSWEPGEGGIAQAKQHMAILTSGAAAPPSAGTRGGAKR